MSEPNKNPALANQPSPAAGQGEAAAANPSSVSPMPPPEMSSTEIASSTGSLTPINLPRVAFPRVRPRERVARYLNSMNAMLPHDQNLDLTHSQRTNDQNMEAAHGTQPSMVGPGLVGRSSFISPFISSVSPSVPSLAVPSHNEIGVSSLPVTTSSHGQSFQQGQADMSTVVSKALEDFMTHLDLRGVSLSPGLPSQARSVSSSHPTFEVGTGFESSSTDVPSARIPLHQFLRPLKAGDMPRPRPSLADIPRAFTTKDSDQVPLKSVDISKLTDADVLFFFGTFCFKARLSPQYFFKYGGPNGQSIGVRLMIYGHTILVTADSPNIHIARVKASRRALLELQKHNPQWQIPPLPISGSNDPKWNWSTFLSAFCEEVGWPKPQAQSYQMNGLWHAELAVADRFFRTHKGCRGREEAHHSVCHHTMYDLLTTSEIEVGRILPAGSPLLSLPEDKAPINSEGGDEGSSFDAVLNSIAKMRAGLGEKKETKPTGKVSGLAGAKIGKLPANSATPKAAKTPEKPAALPKKPADPKPAAPKPAPPKPAPSKRAGRRPPRGAKRSSKGKSAAPPAKEKGLTKQGGDLEGQEAPVRNANKLPLERSRLGPPQNPPAQVPESPAEEDPLATLKEVQTAILGLSPHASFRRLMKTMCMALKVPEPVFEFLPAPTNASGFTHLVQAKWGDDCPWLRRASPVDLGNISWVDQKSTESYGEKRAILFLLKMCREEVDEELLGESWDRDLRGLSRLETEVKSSLRSMEKRSGR